MNKQYSFYFYLGKSLNCSYTTDNYFFLKIYHAWCVRARRCSWLWHPRTSI